MAAFSFAVEPNSACVRRQLMIRTHCYVVYLSERSLIETELEARRASRAKPTSIILATLLNPHSSFPSWKSGTFVVWYLVCTVFLKMTATTETSPIEYARVGWEYPLSFRRDVIARFSLKRTWGRVCAHIPFIYTHTLGHINSTLSKNIECKLHTTQSLCALQIKINKLVLFLQKSRD